VNSKKGHIVSSSTITPELVRLDTDFGETPGDVIGNLAKLVAGAGRTSEPSTLADAATAREEKSRHRCERPRRHPPLPHVRSE